MTTSYNLKRLFNLGMRLKGARKDYLDRLNV